jgi:hypothetical protein
MYHSLVSRNRNPQSLSYNPFVGLYQLKRKFLVSEKSPNLRSPVLLAAEVPLDYSIMHSLEECPPPHRLMFFDP